MLRTRLTTRLSIVAFIGLATIYNGAGAAPPVAWHADAPYWGHNCDAPTAGAALACSCNKWGSAVPCPGTYGYTYNPPWDYFPTSDGGSYGCTPSNTCLDYQYWPIYLSITSCPVGTTPAHLPGNPLNADNQYCAPTAPNAFPTIENLGTPDFCPPGNPINPSNGNKLLHEVDYEPIVDGAIAIERFYNSDGSRRGLFGANWRSNFDRSVRAGAAAQPVYVFRPDGRGISYSKIASGQWTSQASLAEPLTELLDSQGARSGWELRTLKDETERYDATGRLTQIVSRAGVITQQLAYDATGRLSTVTDAYGHILTLTYQAGSGLLTGLTVAGSLSYQYGYDQYQNLSSVTYPDGKIRTYKYENTTFPAVLTGIVDENGVRFATYQYDASGRAYSSEHAGGAERVTLTFNSDQTTVVQDALGASRTYAFTAVNKLAKNTATTGEPCDACGSSSVAARTYDANGNVASAIDFNNNKTCYAYDLTRNLETARVEGLSSNAVCSTVLTTPPASARKISTQWHSTFRLPLKIAEPKRITTWAYDSRGNLNSKTIQATTDLTGSLGFNATPGSSRAWTYTNTYSSVAGILSKVIVNGPRTDVADTTTYDYYAPNATCTASVGDGSTLGCRGQLQKVTNALNQITQFTRYNAHGQPESITDANGVVTTLTYDVRQRLTSRTVQTLATNFEYWPTGLLKKITLPDASYLSYAYDDAHRLTQMQDSIGNKIVYTVDAMGNRTKTEVFDPAGTLVQTQSRVYNSLNRLWKDIGGVNPATEITQYGYDPQGNLTTITDPFSKVTTNQYDALNRLIKVIDPAATGTGTGGNAQYAYDGLDQLTQVTDPRTLATTYTLDGLGNLLQQVSPDTGTTNNNNPAGSGYDTAGNLIKSTDARSIVFTATYDALNRPLQQTWTPPSGSTIPVYTQTFGYDLGVNGKGHLTSLTDDTGNTAWGYDARGRVTTKAVQIGSLSKTVAYAYDTQGKWTGMIYPSGKVLGLTYDQGRVSGLYIDGVPLLLVAGYHPFGQANAWLWGTGPTAHYRLFDKNGRLWAHSMPGGDYRNYVFDAAGRITSWTHTNNTSNYQAFDYDALGRLTLMADQTTSKAYAYDLNGNRTAAVVGATVYAYTYPSTTNRLSSTAGPLPIRNFTYIGTGSIAGDGQYTLSYDARGRLTKATKGTQVTTYAINGLGQRVKKAGPLVPTGTNYFVYDEAGRLIGEYDSAGATIQEYVYLGDLLVGIVRGTTLYRVYADHLGTPRAVTTTGGTVIWRWDSDAFGTNAASEDPDGNGQTFTLNLRFPGQYFDKETNLHYNGFRDYDPQTGRYVQSDPIGFAQSTNLYAYTLGNPVIYRDPSGLYCIFSDGTVIKVTPTSTTREIVERQWETLQAAPVPSPAVPPPTRGFPWPQFELMWQTTIHQSGFVERLYKSTLGGIWKCYDDCGRLTFTGWGTKEGPTQWEREGAFERSFAGSVRRSGAPGLDDLPPIRRSR